MTTSLLTSQNCPHLVIGARSDIQAHDAVAVFARASRRVKSNPDSPFQIEDLTSALALVQASNRSDESGLRYSIPANPDALVLGSFFEFDGSKFSSDGDLTQIDISKIDDPSKASAGQVFLAASMHHLLQWNWQIAAECARVTLRLSEVEDERDEALNILAASLAAQGDGQRALDALRKAVEGKWNLALQANLALLAVDINPSLAVEHMAFLVSGAKTLNDRVRAFSTAIAIWQKNQREETGSSDQDDFAPLPRTFLDSVQTIIADPQISEETFYYYGKFLARVDPVEFQNSEAFKHSPYRTSPSMQLIKAKCSSYFEWMNELVPVAVTCGNTCPWIQEDVDDLVQSLNRQLADNETEDWAIHLAFLSLQKGLECANHRRTLLRGLLILNLPQILEEDAEPSDTFIDWLEEAQMAAQTYHWSLDLDEDVKEFLMEVLHRAGNFLCVSRVRSIETTRKSMEQHVWQIEERMSTVFRRLNAPRLEISRASRVVTQYCSESIITLNRVKSLANDTQLLTAVSILIKGLHTMQRTVEKYQ